jgi:hypothetical protein
MTPEPCKSCGFVHGRMGAKRPEYFGRILAAFEAWKRSASLSTIGIGRPTAASIDFVRGYVVMLLADEQGLCVACADHAVLP